VHARKAPHRLGTVARSSSSSTATPQLEAEHQAEAEQLEQLEPAALELIKNAETRVLAGRGRALEPVAACTRDA
jgi:hypothetical protein